MIMKAYILIHVRPGSVPEVVRNLRRLGGIHEAHMTFGPYDVVAVVDANDVNNLGKLVAGEIQPIPGVLDTLTCLVVEA
jgi:DNA-binding Lrp family transcriptional regulator